MRMRIPLGGARAGNAQRKTMKWGSVIICAGVLCVVAGFLDGDSKLSQCWGQVFKCENQLVMLTLGSSTL